MASQTTNAVPDMRFPTGPNRLAGEAIEAVPPLTIALNGLNERICEQHELIGRLLDRLTSVLQPGSTGPNPVDQPKLVRPKSPAVDQLDGLSGRIAEENARVSDLLSRLDA